MFVQVLWEVKLPTPAVILNSKNHQKSFTALSMLENGISIDPDFSNFSRLTVEVVVLFPKDCHEGTMVKLCAETEWCSTCQCLLSRPRFGVWRLGLTSEASKIFGTKLGGEFVNCDPGPQQFFVGQSWRWWDFSCYAWGFGIGMKKNAEVGVMLMVSSTWMQMEMESKVQESPCWEENYLGWWFLYQLHLIFPIFPLPNL